VSYDIDTNETWGTFRFSPTDVTAFGLSIERDLGAQQLRRPSGVPDWPPVLEGEISLDNLRQAGLEVFKAASPDLFVAVDSKAGVGYFWRPGS
jgi:hypothetical protein